MLSDQNAALDIEHGADIDIAEAVLENDSNETLLLSAGTTTELHKVLRMLVHQNQFPRAASVLELLDKERKIMHLEKKGRVCPAEWRCLEYALDLIACFVETIFCQHKRRHTKRAKL
jgi:hypothetical protein